MVTVVIRGAVSGFRQTVAHGIIGISAVFTVSGAVRTGKTIECIVIIDYCSTIHAIGDLGDIAHFIMRISQAFHQRVIRRKVLQ